MAQEQPGTKPKRGRDDEESEVGPQKCKVEGDALAKLVSDIVDIGLLQGVLAAPLLDPLLVERMVVKGKDGIDMLPLAIGGRDSGAALIAGLGDHEVDQAQTLGLDDGLILQRLCDIVMGGRDADAVKPVAKAGAVDLLREEVGGCDLDKDEEGFVFSMANFGGQADGGEGLDELYKACLSFVAFCGGALGYCRRGRMAGGELITCCRDLVVNDKVDAGAVSWD